MLKKCDRLMKKSRINSEKGEIENGTQAEIDGKLVIYFDGYWIRYYAPPEDSMDARQVLIEHLTRRAFHHTETLARRRGCEASACRQTLDHISCRRARSDAQEHGKTARPLYRLRERCWSVQMSSAERVN